MAGWIILAASLGFITGGVTMAWVLWYWMGGPSLG
jgi:hypothetical protein